MAGAVEATRGTSKRKNSLLRKQLAVALRSVQWSYAIFWSSSPTESGVLEWGEGCYNGDIKKRKKGYEAANYKYALQRSNQLRKLYLCMLEGDSNTTINTADDVDDHGDDEEHYCNSSSMMLSPDDLSDEEWYYLVSMSYVFSPSQCLPGRALATGETIWLCNAHYAENKLFSRSLLARTVVCLPYLGGVIELGVTELISEDPSLLQHIKSCLLETSKPDFSSYNFSSHQDRDDEKNQTKIKISDGNSNSVLQENHQIQFGMSDEDLHYKRTVSTLLKYAADKNIHHLQPDLVSSNTESSFLRWKQHEQPNSILLQEHSNLQPLSQNVLRKILHDVPLMHSLDTKRTFPNKMLGLNQDDPCDRSKENEKFSVLRAMVPAVNKVDKEAILNNTIKYLQELEERVEELESCMGSVNFVERQRKSVNDSELIEETSGNYDDSTKIDGNSGETEQTTMLRDETQYLRVKLKETEVVIEVRCSYRDYIVADIMETLSKLHMDAFSVRSHTLDGFLTLNLKAKFRGAAVAPVGMIKRELRRVIGSPVYYVLLQCGTKEYRSKMSKGDDDSALWNQKFVFDFPMSQWKKLTHFKVRIMDKELFKDGGFVGETIIHLGGIITEGRDRGYVEVKPAPYNVVLDDDTFKGVLKLGFRFTATDKLHIKKAWEVKIEGKSREEPMISPALNLMKLPLLSFLQLEKKMENEDRVYHHQLSIDPNDQSTSETHVSLTMSMDSFVYPRTCSQSTSSSSDQIDEINSSCSEPCDWPVLTESKSSKCLATDLELQTNEILEAQEISEPEVEPMKERFAKLLLGEDMSGSGKGVCTAVTISNAITNLYATVFGQNLRLEPLETEKRAMWKREMNCLLSVCDYIVEFIPRCQSLSNGTTVEVMESRPRGDIYINLPALRKLDSMLMEVLDGFQNTEFWYAEEGSQSMKSANGSFRKVIVQRKEEKWWLPVPLVPPEGLSDKARKQLKSKRESTNQIHKAAMAINSSILSEMEIPESYMATLPKSGKNSVGDSIYRFMSGSGRFFPEKILDSLNIASEHEAVQLADRVEASMYTWRRKACLNNSKNSWNMVKDLMM
ncbi:unnamed protein product [Eruca vesicaria subsp. sativa]|uniref:Uncharacterized protein n=1 Tax=Eruca vesicaria subsp. sativa TaxID=29727 RepID=A0ABC8IPI6_ERUVS|nr:unnamed protein product [Eruca vesicaria subsp. sativa]